MRFGRYHGLIFSIDSIVLSNRGLKGAFSPPELNVRSHSLVRQAYGILGVRLGRGACDGGGSAPWLGEAWINIHNPPTSLTRAEGLEAIDVRNLLAPAGRVVLEKGRKFIAFETSGGGLQPVLVADEEDA